MVVSTEETFRSVDSAPRGSGHEEGISTVTETKAHVDSSTLMNTLLEWHKPERGACAANINANFGTDGRWHVQRGI